MGIGTTGPALRRGAALLAAAVLVLAAGCGEGPGQAPVPAAEPAPVGPAEGNLGEGLDEPKDSPVVGDVTPRKLAERIGCSDFSPNLDDPALGADTPGRLEGTCRLQGQQITVVTFESEQAQQAYLQVHEGKAVIVVGGMWAVMVPNTELASLVRQRLGGEVRNPQ